MDDKKRVLSGIQPTGIFTIGNYFGAIKNWVSMQEKYACNYMIADMHSITVKQDPNILKKNVLSSLALSLACGIDINKSNIFIQSHISEHAELCWVLSSFSQFGELSRMTQFKDKSENNKENINAALFTYPVLQTADILLYNADFVPVGADQKQHIELSRNIAIRFNGIYGDVFTIPEPFMNIGQAKIMSLSDPDKKMSKSDKNQNGFIGILEEKDSIIKKVKKSVTDSEGIVYFGEEKAGINNLIDIYSSITEKTREDIKQEFEGKGYGDFKVKVGEVLADYLEPIRIKYNILISDIGYLEECYKKGGLNARNIASKTLKKVYDKIGFIDK